MNEICEPGCDRNTISVAYAVKATSNNNWGFFEILSAIFYIFSIMPYKNQAKKRLIANAREAKARK